MLRDVLKGEPKVDVVKLQRSGGVVSRNAKFRQKTRSSRTRVKLLFNVFCMKIKLIVFIYFFILEHFGYLMRGKWATMVELRKF